MENLGKDAELPGARHRLSSVGNVELAVDAGRVGFDSALGYDKMLSNLLISSAQGHELEYLQLTLAQWLDQNLFRLP